jgi:hypothetical protein
MVLIANMLSNPLQNNIHYLKTLYQLSFQILRRLQAIYKGLCPV